MIHQKGAFVNGIATLASTRPKTARVIFGLISEKRN
ncbi:MAG: hypothetical protein ACD_5C00278G0001 [uncultured bacterium]|nr:MAG: hypothetical protein ACD_5C00278G0001 [uncultured bacterium]